MSLQQKRALVSLIVIWIAAVGYAVGAVKSPPQTVIQLWLPLVSTAIGLTVMMIFAHILLSIGVGADALRKPVDEADRRVRNIAWRNAGWALAGGLFLLIGLGLLAAPQVLLIQAAVAVFVLSEMVRYSSELFHRRVAA
jgi:hypothetical protein